MAEVTWKDGLKNSVQSLCAIFPEIIRQKWIDRIVECAERIACRTGSNTIGDDILWKAVYEVLPGGYEPLILRFQDPERLKKEMASSKNQENLAPGTEPVQLTRWASPQQKATASPTGKRVVAFNASPRKGGNTDVVIDEVLKACADKGAEVEKIYLCDLTIKPCTGCRACRKTDVKTICAIKDDMTGVYDSLYKADGCVFGFPIYTARENGIMANFMDRWDCILNPYLSNKMPGPKKGLTVCSWMWPSVKAYNNVIEQMIILHRLHNVITEDVLAVTGTRGKNHGRGVIRNHPELLAEAYDAGADFSQCL